MWDLIVSVPDHCLFFLPQTGMVLKHHGEYTIQAESQIHLFRSRSDV